MNHGSYSHYDPYGQAGSYNASSSTSYYYYQDAASPSSSGSSPRMSTSKGNGGDSYQCLVPGCNKSFSRAADLTRHYSTVHHQGQLIECEFGWCGRTGDRGFTRTDHYRDHLREVHQQDIPRSRRCPSSKQNC